MQITSTLSDDKTTLTIHIKDRFVYEERKAFRKAYQNLPIPPEGYILDLDECTFIDSAALGMILILFEQSKCANSNFKIIKAPPDVYELFKISKFTEIMDISSKLND